jgi:hypothetical protein
VSSSVLIRTTVLALVGTGVVLAALLMLVDRADWWRGLLGAGVISALATAGSVPPLLWSLRRGLNQRVAAYFMATGLRATISLGGGVLAVKIGTYPAAPTLLLMVVFYFAILAAETTCLAKVLWDTKD